MKPEPHVLFISSWYPSPTTSEGTFVEMHLLALQSRGCKCAMMLNGETTMGNYIGAQFSKKNLLNFRRREDITFIENLTIHPKPLRFVKDPLAERKKNILKQSLRSIKAYIALYGKPDVIFHHGIFDFTYISEYLAEELNIPIWYMENSPNIEEGTFPCANPFENEESLKNFVKRSDRRFAVTDGYVEKMSRIFGCNFEKVPNVITDDYFVEAPAERPTDEFVFANVAILDPRKRQDLIIKAFATAFKGDHSKKLVIAGDGKLKAELKKLSSDLGVSKQVKIPGYLNRDEVKELLDSSHAFVLASRAETFGVVVIEALARGIPVISSDIPGTREIVTPENGLLFESGNENDLVRAMKEMVVNYDLYRPSELIADVKTRFGPDAVKKGLFENE